MNYWEHAYTEKTRVLFTWNLSSGKSPAFKLARAYRQGLWGKVNGSTVEKIPRRTKTQEIWLESNNLLDSQPPADLSRKGPGQLSVLSLWTTGCQDLNFLWDINLVQTTASGKIQGSYGTTFSNLS